MNKIKFPDFLWYLSQNKGRDVAAEVLNSACLFDASVFSPA